ncbi:MAG: PKD domain-containing protein [Cyclobacteriaceae bacterium]
MIRVVKSLALIWIGLLYLMTDAGAQCNALRPQIDISFNTDQDCAPVTVTQFTITYYFNVSQNPNDIEIMYEWNDPANTVTVINLGSGLIAGATASGPNTSFTANSTFTYFDNNGQCSITPTASIIINGVLCPSSSQTQLAFFWGTDEQANGNISMTPANWDVCFDNPVVNAVFTDNSDFNCNINVEPDNPNRFARHVQFVYGTNHNPAATIRNLSLNDGAVQGLTNASGNLVNTITRGTVGLPVTGAYFGPIDAIPFPADGPVSTTFPMSAPADVANLVGNRFEVTLFNWNICNPWNGDTANPNYEDAVTTTGYIVIVAAPAPAFVTEDNTGAATKNFCIGETIFFNNNTPNLNAYAYTWEFYDDAAGTILIDTRNQSNPTFAFSSGGTKLIRLIATNPTAQGACTEVYTDVVNITPSVTAIIAMTDFSNVPISGEFCQEPASPFTNFQVRFRDVSTGTITPTTEWRWEFYNESNVLVRREPAAGYSATQLGPFDEVFTNPGVYRVRLFIRDNLTSCESVAETYVRVFNKPQPAFTFNRVCVGTATAFTESSSLVSINGQQIVSWEWDMNYDGITFVSNALLVNQRNFNFTFPSAGSYNVALRVTTDQGGCSSMLVQPVSVDAVPNALFSSSVASGCSVLSVTLTNNSIVGQPAIIDQFVWEVDEGSGFQVDSIQRPTDPGFTNVYSRNFENFGLVNRQYQVRLRVVTQNGCEQISAPQIITVFPGPRSGFMATNYSPFNQNCSPQSVNFAVDNQTQSMNPSDYRWTVTDPSGVLIDQSTGTTPAFSFNFVNTTQAIRDYQITLRTTLPTACFRDSTLTIRINPVPVSDFTTDTLQFDCQVMNMRFEATQKGLSQYTWTVIVNGVTLFTQASSADFLNFNFTRSAVVQSVEVQLQTTNFASCVSAVTLSLFDVPVNDNIAVAFSATPINQSLPNSTVTITNSTTPGSWQYLWDFGDGSTSTNPNPGSHTYATYGSYSIVLTVSNNICVQSQTVTITIDPIPPILDFSFNPASGCAPLTVTFTNLSQFADPTTYFWEFGTNQGTSRSVNPVYTYNEPGIYSVTLSATNIIGDTVSITKSSIIEVFAAPIAQFTVRPTLVYVPGGKIYLDNQSFGAGSYLWDFGDGGTSTEFEPVYTYTTEGTYDITLTTVNSLGCSDTARLQAAVRAEKGAQILMPNAFTPGKDGPGSGDGQNDTFLPLVRGVSEFQMLIFNRWGELLFESKNAEVGWDGYYQGRLCQQDVYMYKITAKYENGDVVTRMGDIHLMR